MAIEFFMQKMTDSMEFGIIVDWLYKEGDFIKKGQPILEIETDKAMVELVSPATGVLKGIRDGVVPGAKVPVGEPIAFIVEQGEEAPILPPIPAQVESNRWEDQIPITTPKDPSYSRQSQIRATPDVRRLARDIGINLSLVKASSLNGRITREDVLAFAKSQQAGSLRDTGAGQVSSEVSKIADETIDEVEWLNLTRVQKVTGERMLESVQTVPQFSLTTRVDMINALNFRKDELEEVSNGIEIPISITTILIKLVANALKEFPRANASFIDGRIKMHKHINIGIALGTDGGLFVPVIKDAEMKSLIEIAQKIKYFQEKASEMRFELDDLSGGTFTISNLGMYGVDQFNAIINPPETAILAIGRIINTPVALLDGSIGLRPLMSMTLSIDHRSMDGLQGGKFLSRLREFLEQPDLANLN